MGVIGSLQLASQQFKGASSTLSGTTIVGFQTGVLLSSPLNEHLSIRPYLLYSVKGSNYSFGSTSVIRTFNHVAMPVQATYSFDVNTGHIVAGAGPFVAYAVGGTDKSDSLSAPIEFGSKSGEVRRFDYGLRISIGYELERGLGFMTYYEPSLANLTNIPSVTAKNSAFGFALYYLLEAND
ncbi:outer membrane protein with beta-barrel domain [Spirosoma oryzae]|uniref:Outer membrane protein with beta-barrel domain n=1 Tax=Spirosoma oryzae TaxID=1469603 RepID=A0A2T0TIC4_9BACT|nr:porin family protein [Spirosoma oryzae]PRY45457.1 outer membrane protein with beta-barrel domain [Spirosoma oryzae]